jgi:hypothetical protein
VRDLTALPKAHRWRAQARRPEAGRKQRETNQWHDHFTPPDCGRLGHSDRLT